MKGLGGLIKAGLGQLGIHQRPMQAGYPARGCICPKLEKALDRISPWHRDYRKPSPMVARRMYLSTPEKLARPVGVTRRVSWPGRQRTRTAGYFPFSSYGAAGGSGVINADSLKQDKVQEAFSQVATDTVQINLPQGIETWVSPNAHATLTLPLGIGTMSVMGAGNLGVVGGSSASQIIDGNENDDEVIVIDAGAIGFNAATHLRLAGLFMYRVASRAKGQGFIKYIGSHNVRVDHNTFYGFGGMYNMVFYCANGVIDHNIADFGFQSVTSGGGTGTCDPWGDLSWSQATGFGLERFLFIEDNLLQPNDPNNSVGGNHGDCRGGTRVVIRHNTMRGVISHGDDGDLGRQRGCRALEVYENFFQDVSGGAAFNTIAVVTGSALIWGNEILTPGSYSAFTSLHMGRASTTEGPRQGWPNDWGFCGNVPGGGGPSLIDQNTDSTGHRCLDMVGSGPGDLLANDFPNIVNVATGFGPNDPRVYPRHTSEPVYEWLTSGFSGPQSQRVLVFEPHVIFENRDYYAYKGLAVAQGGPFNGTVGVGSGLFANRPATCSPKVAYWATDQRALYQCSAPNTWTLYYQPYPYPHPLVTGGGGPTNPPPTPTGYDWN